MFFNQSNGDWKRVEKRLCQGSMYSISPNPAGNRFSESPWLRRSYARTSGEKKSSGPATSETLQQKSESQRRSRNLILCYGYVMDMLWIQQSICFLDKFALCILKDLKKKQLPGPGRGILHRTRPCAVSPGHPTVPSTPGITWTNSNVCEPTMVLRCFTYQIYGGFLKWGYPYCWWKKSCTTFKGLHLKPRAPKLILLEDTVIKMDLCEWRKSCTTC